MRAVITVIGNDKVGIIYHVSEILFHSNINILDISQTIMQDIFTMVTLVDISEATCSFEEISDKLAQLGKKLNVSIHIQHEDIFHSMHRI
jgi:ACT domain-containing protein